MKKVLVKILVFCSAFTLTACDFLAFLTPNNSGNGGGGGDNPPAPSVTVSSVSITNNKVYCIGDSYSNDDNVITVNYSNGTSNEVPSSYIRTSKITDPLGQTFSKSSQFNRAGSYYLKCTVRVEGTNYNAETNFSVQSGFVTTGFTLESFELSSTPAFRSGEVVNDRLDNLNFLLHWNHGDEYYLYNKSTDTNGFTFSVNKQGDGLNEYIDEELEAGTSYSLIISYGAISYKYDFTISNNYYRLNSEDIKKTYSSLENNLAPQKGGCVSPSKGSVKMLIIPITLIGNYTDTWTTARLSEIDGYYFGMDTDKISLKKYYETASFGQMNVSGLVTEPYTETSTSLTSSAIQSDTSYAKLFQLIKNAVNYIKTNYPSINFDDYDLNDDGAIDNIHLITNFNTSSYKDGTGESPWSTPLWPHKFQTGETGTKASPVANVYSISAIDHVYDGITAIHEQGHIFGLDDYYDYGQTDVDYVGYADMQSYNIFDWNSYSKFSVGWISPYVVTGPTELTLQAASINGDCLVVPADPETFSNSAFDEYFLIELFSPYGNNIMNYPVNGAYQDNAWEYYSNRYGDLGSYGVRLYHVNAQLYKYTGGSFVPYDDDEIPNSYLYQATDNNIYDYSGRANVFDDYADFKHLAVIQRGGVDTFGSTDSKARHFLSKNDLFRQGDVFTFDAYKQFLTKTNAIPTTMNNGEIFPYKITFTEMSATQVTVKVELA